MKQNRLQFFFFLIILLFTHLTGICQTKFDIPTDYDSIQSGKRGDYKNGEKYYKNGNIIFEIRYRFKGSIEEKKGYSYINADSCYFYSNKDQYKLYYFHMDTIIHENCAENSSIYFYRKYFRSSDATIESGRYYVLRQRDNDIFDCERYKIGLWQYYKDGNIYKSIDYDNYEINGETIVFKNPKAQILNEIKVLTDSIVKQTFGNTFYEKYIKFNLDFSRYDSVVGKSNHNNYFLTHTNQNIIDAEVYYDIVINDSLRFNAIHFRTHRRPFKSLNEKLDADDFYARGLDTTLVAFNEIALNFELIAKETGFDLSSKYFYLTMEREERVTWDTRLYFKMMQYKEETDPNEIKNGHKVRGYYYSILIDPVSGVVRWLPRKVLL